MALAGAAVGLVPIGTILPYAGDALVDDTNWRFCDGQQLDQNRYHDLFNIIGTKWGGDGATKFCLPKLNGVFLRGVDPNRDVDRDGRSASRPDLPDQGNSSGVGSRQADEVQRHGHGVNDPGHSHRYRVPDGDGSSAKHEQGGLQWVATESSTTGITIAEYGGAETRPVNVAVQYVIRVS